MLERTMDYKMQHNVAVCMEGASSLTVPLLLVLSFLIFLHLVLAANAV